MFGCETSAAKFTGGVKYIADDYALECQVCTHLTCLSCHNMSHLHSAFAVVSAALLLGDRQAWITLTTQHFRHAVVVAAAGTSCITQ